MPGEILGPDPALGDLLVAASRQQSKLSIMPAGLQAAMTTQELVDLVEYLAALKKAGAAPLP